MSVIDVVGCWQLGSRAVVGRDGKSAWVGSGRAEVVKMRVPSLQRMYKVRAVCQLDESTMLLMVSRICRGAAARGRKMEG